MCIGMKVEIVECIVHLNNVKDVRDYAYDLKAAKLLSFGFNKDSVPFSTMNIIQLESVLKL